MPSRLYSDLAECDPVSLRFDALAARDKPGLLIAMMRALAGDAHISLEGNLGQTAFPETPHPSGEETAVPREGAQRWHG